VGIAHLFPTEVLVGDAHPTRTVGSIPAAATETQNKVKKSQHSLQCSSHIGPGRREPVPTGPTKALGQESQSKLGQRQTFLDPFAQNRWLRAATTVPSGTEIQSQ
jgi:hypothetical protein